MEKLIYSFKYKHIAFFVSKQGLIEVGNVLKFYEDKENNTCEITLEFNQDLPKELKILIEKDPRGLQFRKVPEKLESSLILP